MPKTLTEVDVFTPFIAVPQDGDGLAAGSVEAPVQSLANRTTHLNRRLTTVETGSSVGTARYHSPCDRITALSDNQTTFTASYSAVAHPIALLYLNGVPLGTGAFSHSGTTITVSGITVLTGDVLLAEYWEA